MAKRYQLHIMAEGEQGSRLLCGSEDLTALKQDADCRKTQSQENGDTHFKYVVVDGYRTVYKGKYDSRWVI